MAMATSLGSLYVNALDLLALVCCVGISSFLAFVAPPRDLARQGSHTVLAPLWRLQGICLALLTISSLGWLVDRAMAGSGQPLGALASVLPAMLMKTHFGHVWLIRPAALLVLWLGWRNLHRRPSAKAVWTMLIASAAMAATRSLSGHAADWGDITLAEVVDWLHVLAASAWGGSVIALLLTGFHAISASAETRRQAVVALIVRWSSFAGAALAVVVSTGLYNAWRELGRVGALWTTAYGQLLSVKLLLVVIAVALGAANRYVGIPTLRAWEHGAADDGGWSALTRFIRRAALEGAALMAVIIVVAVLIRLAPARHAGQAPAVHTNHSHGMQ